MLATIGAPPGDFNIFLTSKKFRKFYKIIFFIGRSFLYLQYNQLIQTTMKALAFISKNIFPLISLSLLIGIVTLVIYNSFVYGICDSTPFDSLGH